MRCTDPRTVGFYADGKTICWSQKHYSKEYATFQLPCGQCLECRLNYAREWAVRCVHEAQMYENNSFITLTYDDEHLKSPKLQYRDFQLFMKRLRFAYPNSQIGCFVTGEYGEKNKRPHWHAILFNWSPPDQEFLRSNERGDRIFKSPVLDRLWGNNDPIKKPNEVGSVTFESAGYCARYAAKKLVHGNDCDHEWHPISKKSSKHAIGKKWLEKFWPDVFNYGYIIINGEKISVPRYYEKWLQKNHPTEWVRYVTQIKSDKNKTAALRAEKEQQEWLKIQLSRQYWKKGLITRTQARKKILDQKFKEQLQAHLKL